MLENGCWPLNAERNKSWLGVHINLKCNFHPLPSTHVGFMLLNIKYQDLYATRQLY